MRIGLRSIALAVTGGACLGAAAVVVAGACVVVPPPDFTPMQAKTPRILHDSVSPPEGIPFAEWPDVFIVPVQMEDPDPTAIPSYVVHVGPPDKLVPSQDLPAPSPSDGGLVLIHFAIDQQAQNIDPGFCHTITAFVSDPHANGSDSVPWVYGGSGAPYGCPIYDAGPEQDGQFPPDAPPDGLPKGPAGDP